MSFINKKKELYNYIYKVVVIKVRQLRESTRKKSRWLHRKLEVDTSP